ncbi:hypothetical protein Tco_1267889 [Tanacetum coccineum]
MRCDDAYRVTPRDSALTGCDRFVSEPLVIEKRFRWEIVYPPPEPKRWIDPKTGWRMKRIAYKRLVPVITSYEDSEKKGEPKKKQLKGESESDSNTLPPDYTTPNEETETDLDSTVTNNVNNANANRGNGNSGNRNSGNNNGCTYKEFLACNPRDFDGKGRAIAVTWWIEKRESARGHEAALGMTRDEFKALRAEEFCPSNKMEKLETEFWNHAMVGSNHVVYTDRFHELAKLVQHLVTPESERIERYIHGLAPQIYGMIRATQLVTIQSVILKAGAQTDEAVRCGTLSKSSEKRKGVAESSKTRTSMKLPMLMMSSVVFDFKSALQHASSL